MNTLQILRRLAVLSLLVVALAGFDGSLRHSSGTPPFMTILMPLVTIAFWSWLILRVWRRPREWGPGVGILLLLMIGVQTHLWRLSVNSPHPEIRARSHSPLRFAFSVLPLLVGGVSCLLLRLRPGRSLVVLAGPAPASGSATPPAMVGRHGEGNHSPAE